MSEVLAMLVMCVAGIYLGVTFGQVTVRAGFLRTLVVLVYGFMLGTSFGKFSERVDCDKEATSRKDHP